MQNTTMSHYIGIRLNIVKQRFMTFIMCTRLFRNMVFAVASKRTLFKGKTFYIQTPMHEIKLLNRLDQAFSSYMYQSKVLVNCLEHLKLVPTCTFSSQSSLVNCLEHLTLLLTCTFSSQSSLITSLIAALQEKKLFCISSFNFYNQRRGLFFRYYYSWFQHT